MIKGCINYWAPGLYQFKDYQRAWLGDDIRASFSVIAVALPVAIAYAQLTGVSAIVGLYSCALPMIVYAFFGTSRQLITGPDAATCAVVAAVVAPLAGGDPVVYWQLVITMTLMTGGWCLLASYFKLGILADFLSRPILLGLLNGVAITIIVGQFAKVLGLSFNKDQMLEQLIETPLMLTNVQWQTVMISAATAIIYFVCKRFKPTWPAAMFAIALAALATWAGQLNNFGVDIVGTVDGGFPVFQAPLFSLADGQELVMPAFNLAMVSFVSMMLTARSFAAKNGYEIDADKEFRALGFANIASALSSGFAISGADSRTAVNDANGGKSQLVSIIAGVSIGLIAIFAYQPLEFIPIAALGMVLIIASFSLLDLKGLWALRRRDKSAFYLAVTTFIAVLAIGVIPGITLAVLLGLFQFVRIVMRPSDQILGLSDQGRVRTIDSGNKAKPIPGLLIYRFNSPLTYFNAPYFKRQLLKHVYLTDKKDLSCVIIDSVACFTHMDVSVMSMISDLQIQLKKQGVRLILAGRKRQLRSWCDVMGIPVGDGGIIIRSDMYLAIKLSACYREAVAEGNIVELQRNEYHKQEADTNISAEI
ncbi:SulP family inorganic anion transporter [Vibrio sp. S11_S32]|uniref:SulP family inorganic anion transporter n=1 Tax=Vibrio sp. S11_S32 TaxID=2720225 RepID=UPI0016811B32|nr:SulP family inorganic anion transporter [Vibrio sp. S11_S32]MBD1577647.1 SulP family inorganic anion transporter [Vibrio sp. S11_S32]